MDFIVEFYETASGNCPVRDFMEELNASDPDDFAAVLAGLRGLKKILDFISACMTGAEKTAFLNAVKSCQGGGRRGATNFGKLITIGVAVVEGTADKALLDLMQGFHHKEATRLFRKEMFFAMGSALQLRSTRNFDTLADAIWEVQNRIRHVGRKMGKRSIGSTLLVKGLEFDHAVIIHSDNMTRKDWYVALTRATTSVTILSPLQYIVPSK